MPKYKYNLDEIKQIPIYNFLNGWNKKNGTKDYIYENCPFCTHKWHFSVSKDGKFFTSYNSCTPGGSVIDFISKFYNLSFYDSIKLLADKYKIEGNSKINKYDTEKNKKISAIEKNREREIINDFFDFLKVKEYDRTFYKILNWNDLKILHYIYDLVAAGFYHFS
jgi:hypothetical protein